jgi:hypothetical protein
MSPDKKEQDHHHLDSLYALRLLLLCPPVKVKFQLDTWKKFLDKRLRKAPNEIR